MAVTIPPTGSGTATPVVATDVVAAAHYQWVKPDLGTAGAHVEVSTGAGAVGTGTQRVTLGSDDPAVSTLALIFAEAASLATVGGGTEAGTLRVTLANDSTGVVSVDDNGGLLSVDDGAGSLTVDNPILSVVGGGTQAAAQRVTIASDSTGVIAVTDNSGSLTIDNAALSVTGGGVQASALRVTLASDSTGVVAVTDNSGSLTVDNTTLSVVGAGTDGTALRTVEARNAHWAVHHVPATNVQATISQGAGGGGIRNVCTGFTVTLAAGASAPTAAAPITVALIDGASGGTTYLWRTIINLPATAGAITSFTPAGDRWVGTANTAMTLEFSAAGGTNTYESVSMHGTTSSGN